MSTDWLSQWLDKLGYNAEPGALHRAGEPVPARHPYALELQALLKPTGAIRAQAVFDVEGVPTVVFVGSSDGQPLAESDLDGLRKRIWNQNLASVVISVLEHTATALPVRRLGEAGESLTLAHARSDGPFSMADVRSSDLSRRLPSWFDAKARVDRKLLDNLSAAVSQLVATGVSRRQAELLMGQVLFISYLEHRGIVSSVYRQKRQVAALHDLVAGADAQGVASLIHWLHEDFNGDFLAEDGQAPWHGLTAKGFDVLNRFLCHTDLTTGQRDFWNYDFSFIPVELLSGLYESFMTAEQQAADGAYYTPRHLATLAVERAFAASPNPLTERIFDGACGSGILLTTAYRRLIALHEARNGVSMSFVQRRQLLLDHIFGGDTNPMACRVTAFSLYLSLLEGLDPSDVLDAQERYGVKLPSLRGSNLCGGQSADFFSDDHPFAGQRFSLLISNPPWKEPPGGVSTSADEWSRGQHAPFVRRQIAGAFSLKALDYLTEGGRLCFILPITQFLGPTSEPYVPYFFDRVQPRELINFGDLQQLLFPTAENTCHVFVGTRRPLSARGRISVTETFEYRVPKADLSLAFGRLTLQSADRHQLQTQAVREDPQLLVALMWGDNDDVALWTRLSTHGTFSDFWTGPKRQRRWINRKGVHFEDKSRQSDPVGLLRQMPFIPVDILRLGVPVLDKSLLQKWPREQTHVVGLSDELMGIFKGPRVLYPDGFSKQEHSVRAVFYDGPGVFKHSVGVISGPPEDEALLRFAAIYLRSSLARYFLMLRGWKMLCERNGVHLEDVEAFPFFAPERAPAPAAAKKALEKIARFSKELEQIPQLEQASYFQQHKDALDDSVFEYFDLSATERQLVRETVDVLMPSIRPRSYKSLDTPIQQRASKADMEGYASTLARALAMWRDRMGGRGEFHVRVVGMDPRHCGPVGVVRIQLLPEGTGDSTAETELDTALVEQTLAALRREGLGRVADGESWQLLPDTLIWAEHGLYLTRPLTRRGWLTRSALRDAERIVRDVHQSRTSRIPEIA